MKQAKVVILDNRFPHHDFEKSILSDYEVVENTTASTQEEVLAAADDADVIIVNLVPMTERIIDQLEHCRGIVRYGAGFDSVAIAAAGRRGIPVVNVPDFCMEEVSDQTIALWMSCVRLIPQRDRQLREGLWDAPAPYTSRRISGRTFGIYGYGRIGQTLHRKLTGFSLGKILVHDPFVSEDAIRAAGAVPAGFEELLSEADYLSVHAPLTEKTRHIFGREAFSSMKKGSIFINTSRGGLMDTAALMEALSNGTILAAGVDVHEQEPFPTDYPLIRMDNVILSDHRGWFSEESQEELQKKAAWAARKILEGEIPENTVNRDLLSR